MMFKQVVALLALAVGGLTAPASFRGVTTTTPLTRPVSAPTLGIVMPRQIAPGVSPPAGFNMFV